MTNVNKKMVFFKASLIKYKDRHLVRLAVDSAQRGVADPGHPGELGEVGRGRGGVAVREQHHLAGAVLWSLS